MSNKIKILSSDEVIKIAAGEVVRRPASVVKELLENSLDAGAKNITIFIDGGGKSALKIVDDGCGMSADDLQLSVELHATSKIEKLEDLQTICSFGFRGEALASISKVSRFVMTSRQACDDLASMIAFNTGSAETFVAHAIAHSVGTTVEVGEIFFNVPARRKFLRSADSEFQSIWQVVLQMALSNTHVSFRLIKDGKETLFAPSCQSVVERVAQLFDPYLADNMVPVSASSGEVSVSGVVSNLSITRYNRNQIYMFVNGRAVKSTTLSSAICQGYAGALPDQKFPVAAIFLTIDPAMVDVNVHPAKEEVALLSPGKVCDAVRQAVVSALERVVQAQVMPEQKPRESFYDANFLQTKYFAPKAEVTLPRWSAGVELDRGSVIESASDKAFSSSKPDGLFFDAPTLEMESPTEQQNCAQLEDFLVVGQIFATYILAQKGEDFVIFDQHAVSERVLYEAMKNNYSDMPALSLLFPESVVLSSAQDMKVLLLAQNLLQGFGVIFEQFGPNIVVLKAVPPRASIDDVREMLFAVINILNDSCDIAGDYITNVARQKIFEHVHSHLACKTAIKAGDVLSIDSATQLLKQLFDCPNNFQCIHGRPTMHVLSKKQLEKIFRR